jgi:hypothetical protein
LTVFFLTVKSGKNGKETVSREAVGPKKQLKQTRPNDGFSRKRPAAGSLPSTSCRRGSAGDGASGGRAHAQWHLFWARACVYVCVCGVYVYTLPFMMHSCSCNDLVVVCGAFVERAGVVWQCTSDRREGFNTFFYFTVFLTLTALNVDLPLTVDRKKKAYSKALDELCSRSNFSPNYGFRRKRHAGGSLQCTNCVRLTTRAE